MSAAVTQELINANPERPKMIDKLVADRTVHKAPNSLLDNQMYVKVGGNDVFRVEPPVVHFRGFEINKPQKKSFYITNISTQSHRLNVLHPPPKSPFSISFPRKLGKMAPGLTQEVKVHITPKEYKYYSENIKVFTNLNFIIPLHAYPAVSLVHFPKVIEMGNVPLGEKVSRSFALESKVPVQFEYKLTEMNHNPNFTVEPMQGAIGPSGRTKFTITFEPARQITTTMQLKLEVSQFGFEPMIATVSGSSAGITEPGEIRAGVTTLIELDNHRKQGAGVQPKFVTSSSLALKSLNPAETSKFYPSTQDTLLNPREQTRNFASLTTKIFSPKGKKKVAVETKEEPKFIRGVRVPDMFSVMSTNAMLNFQPGKMTIAEMKEAIAVQQKLQEEKQEALEKQMASLAKENGESEDRSHPTDFSSKANTDVVFQGATDQMRQMVFLRRLKDYDEHEKSLSINPTKERIGQKTMGEDQREQIIVTWKKEAKDAAQKIRESQRNSNAHVMVKSKEERVIYPVEREDNTIEFGEVGQNDWKVRQAALESFVESMTTIIVRNRVDARLDRLKKFLSNRSDDDLYKRTTLHFDFNFKPQNLAAVSFPVLDNAFEKPPPQKIQPIPDIFPIEKFKLKVPLTYKLLDYKPIPIPALPVYLSPHEERSMRSGALEEHLYLPQRGLDPKKAGSITIAAAIKSVLGSRRDLGKAAEQNALLVYAPPAKLFEDSDEEGEAADVENSDEVEEEEQQEQKTEEKDLSHLITESNYTIPGTKSWPFTLLRSHPSLYPHSEMTLDSEVNPGAFALKPIPIGDVKKQRYYLTEEAGSGTLPSLEQTPTMTNRWQGKQSLDLRFSFAALIPLKHPHVDVDEEIPLQKGLDSEDELSDSDTDDEENAYKPTIPTVEFCRKMFMEDIDAKLGRETEAATQTAIRIAKEETNQEIDEERFTQLTRLPILIDECNAKTKDTFLHVANFLS